MSIKEDFDKEFGFLRRQNDAIRFSDIERAAQWMAERYAQAIENTSLPDKHRHASAIRELAKELR